MEDHSRLIIGSDGNVFFDLKLLGNLILPKKGWVIENYELYLHYGWSSNLSRPISSGVAI